MTKGAAYRAYYVANRERILEANRERSKAAREKRKEASPEVKAAQLAREREAFYDRRAKGAKEAFVAKAEVAEGDMKTFYETLARADNLGAIPKKQMDWLLSLRAAPASTS